MKGYGNIVPYSDAGKIFTMVIILPFIACAMSIYAITGEIITSSIEILLLTVRQKSSTRLICYFSKKEIKHFYHDSLKITSTIIKKSKNDNFNENTSSLINVCLGQKFQNKI